MRSRSAQALTTDVQRQYGPGVTVWGKGDPAHQGSPSDHNEDDTPGSKPEQQDADSIPEHRGLDIPPAGPMSWADLDDLRVKLTGRPANRARLRYVILRQTIWRKRNGWRADPYTGDYHGHLHVSIEAADDDNTMPWDIGDHTNPEGDDVTPEERDRLYGLAWRAEALINDRPAVVDNEETREFGVAGQENVIHTRLDRIEAKLDAIIADRVDQFTGGAS